ncbi:MAG: SDR family NAD(P)-dependent oxidoreductase [Deltaproteobacteria bacterium]|nr:SDR family NAD(P)-dependent oxidoreductase [Deltaproteobacteria bacterium]
MKHPVAIVGIGCIFPDAPDFARYWANIKRGHDAIREIPEGHWPVEDYFRDAPAPDLTYARRGGFIPPTDFDPLAFGIVPDNLEATDTTQLLGMLVAQKALEDAGFDPAEEDTEKVSVVLGVTGTLPLVIPLGARLGHPIWRKALKDAGVEGELAEDVVQRISDAYVPWKENSFPGLLGNVVAGRIANRLDLHGTNCVVDAACASSLSAAHLAAMELESGRADLVVTGGLDTFNDIFMYMCFSQTPALSPSGDSRPFDRDGDGTILGEGLGIVVLKRLEDAERDGDRIYALIKAVGSSSDGQGQAIYAPSAAGQARALRKAYSAAGVGPETVELVESHGTGTKVGDAIEATALSEVFREARAEGTWCALGSVKSQIGHTKAAAGAAGLIKAALALHHRVLPPTIKVEQPLEMLAAGKTPFYVNTQQRPWLPAAAGHPRRAAVSALGFGGSNFHVVLEEYPDSHPGIDWTGTVQIVPFSASSREQLLAALDGWEKLSCWTDRRVWAGALRASFDPGAPLRLAFVASAEPGDDEVDLERVRRHLGDESKTSFTTPDGACFEARAGEAPGRLAFLFPGQGAQYPGMLRDLACAFPQLQESLAAADAALELGGARLVDRIYPHSIFDAEARAESVAALRATEVAQPALGAVSLGALELLRHFGLSPDAVAGHSYGELVALTAAGVIDPADLPALSRLRGELMAGMAEGDAGTMLAASCELPRLEAILAEAGLEVVVANRNTPTQNVLSGSRKAIEAAEALLVTKEIPVTRLEVAAAFHSPLVAGAEGPLREALDGRPFGEPGLPVWANTTARPYPPEADAARALLAGQLARPVEFCATLEGLHAEGVRTFVEVGPGARLSGMVQKTLQDPDVQALALDASSGRRNGLIDLGRLLARLAVLGHELELERWDPEAIGSKPEAPARKGPKMSVPLSGVNYVSPRPARPPATPRPVLAPATAAPAPAPAALPSSAPVVGTSSRPTAAPIAFTEQVRPMSDDPRHAALNANLQALLQMQSQTADLHRLFLEGQEAATATFRDLILRQQGLITGQAVEPLALSTGHGLPALAAVAAPAIVAAPQPVPAPALAPAPVAQPEPALTAVAPAPAAGVELAPALLEIVSERTGYPVEVLELDMDLDTDLGIDSIKRVEILSALQAKLPGLAAPDPEALGQLRTLGEIVAFMQDAPAPAPAAAPLAGAAPSAADLPGDGSVISAALLEVVSEKTGYPVEVLELDMDLDTDLGIDSIKRVEILSALQARHPELPAPDPEQLAELRTLGSIVSFLYGAAEGVPAAAPAPAAKAPVTPAAPAAAPAAGPRPLYRAELASAPLGSEAGALSLPAGTVVLIDGGDALGEALALALRARGSETLRLGWREVEGAALPGQVAGLLLLPPLTLEAEAELELFQAALRGLQRVRPLLSTGALLSSLSRMDGHLGLAGTASADAVTGGALAGLIKTAGLEWEGCQARVLDLDPELAVSAGAILDALLAAGPVERGLSAEGLRGLVLHEAEVPAGGHRFGREDRVLLTGGARGVTAAAALALAEASQATLFLLGRSPAPAAEPEWLAALADEAAIKRALLERGGGQSGALAAIEQECQAILRDREIRENLRRIEAAGSRVIYRSVDLRDAAALAAVLAELGAEHGAPTAVVHGAGVLADGHLDEKRAEGLAAVVTTKLTGWRNLRAALEGAPLKALVFFSSTTARVGRRGQADYALANEALDKLAHVERAARPGTRVVSIGWGPWEGGMVTPSLARLFAAEGVPLIPLPAGARLLVDELQAPPEAAAQTVVLGGPVDQPGLAPAPRSAAAPAAGAEHLAFEIGLEPERQPFLSDHVIAGQAVLPLALSAEWLAQAALHEQPGLELIGIDGLRLFKGVRLGAGERRALELRFGAARGEAGLLRLPARLQERGERPNVQAEVLLGDAAQRQEPPRLLTLPARRIASGLAAEPAALYRTLFHGNALRCLESLEAHTEQQIVARIRRAPQPAEWLEAPLRGSWLTDPLALDAAFQLGILWSVAARGEPCLPAAVATYRQKVSRFPETMLLLGEVESLEGQTLKMAFDWRSIEGELLAWMRGAEMILDPALTRAFEERSLAPRTGPEVRIEQR